MDGAKPTFQCQNQGVSVGVERSPPFKESRNEMSKLADILTGMSPLEFSLEMRQMITWI